MATTVDILCAAAGRNLFVGKGFAFFDELKHPRFFGIGDVYFCC